MNIDDYRISKLRDYLFNIINTLTTNRKYQINANMLSDRIEDYSLDKIPVQPNVDNWIIGVVKKRDVYSFRSLKTYSQDTINNLKNVGFFEELEKTISSNNKNGVMPEIENIEQIACLNGGSMTRNIDGKKAEFEIQIEITYRS